MAFPITLLSCCDSPVAGRGRICQSGSSAGLFKYEFLTLTLCNTRLSNCILFIVLYPVTKSKGHWICCTRAKVLWTAILQEFYIFWNMPSAVCSCRGYSWLLLRPVLRGGSWELNYTLFALFVSHWVIIFCPF